MSRKSTDVVARGPLLDEVVNTLTSDAEFDGETRELGLRIAPAPDDNLGLKLKWYYDLTNDEYEFVEITSKGWEIKKNQIIFRRFDHQKAQDYPNASGDYPPDIFDQFLDLLNVKKENRLILKCYIISLFIPNLPKSVLMVHGEQGTAEIHARRDHKNAGGPKRGKDAFLSKRRCRISTTTFSPQCYLL